MGGEEDGEGPLFPPLGESWGGLYGGMSWLSLSLRDPVSPSSLVSVRMASIEKGFCLATRGGLVVVSMATGDYSLSDPSLIRE